MDSIDRSEVRELIEDHQRGCVKSIETALGNLGGSLTSLHNKVDVANLAINKAGLDNVKLEERLEAGRRHFERLDKQVEDLQKADQNIWQSLGKIILWIAVGCGGGLGFVKFFGG